MRTVGWLAALLGLIGCSELPLESPEPNLTCEMQLRGDVDEPGAATAAGLSIDEVAERVTWQADTVIFAWGEVVDAPVMVSFEPKGGALEMEYSDADGEVCDKSGVYLELSGRVHVEAEGWASADERVGLSGSAADGVAQPGTPFPLVGEPALREAYEAAEGETCSVFRPVGRLSDGKLSVDVLGTCGGQDVDELLFEVTARG